MKFVFLLGFALSFQAYAKTIEIARTDGSLLRFYFEVPAKAPYPIVFLVQGSTCTSSYSLIQMVAAPFLQHGMGVIAIEKYGLKETSNSCPQEYLINNTIQNRINDHLVVAEYIRNNVSQWNGKFAWAGGSEGGQISALAAPLVHETAMIVMMASGGGLTMAEELPIAFERLMRRQGASDNKIQRKKKELQNSFRMIKKDPTPYKEWLSDGKSARNTYKYWDAILWIKALPLLERTSVPMLLVHGTEDTSCPIESSQALANRFKDLGKTNLTFKIYPGLEHNWSDLQGSSHTQEVLNDTFSWIFQNFPK